MNQIIESNIEKIRSLCLKFQVNKLYTFGSVNTDKFTEDSDIDFLVDFKPMDYSDYADSYLDFADQLESVLNKSVDLLTYKSLQNPFFIESINQNKRLIYEN